MASVSCVKTAKSLMRKEMKTLILSLTDRATQSRAVTRKILSDPDFVKARSVALFLSMKDEIQTEDILESALRFDG